LKRHIFTTTTPFHRTSITNHDLEFFHTMDVVVSFLGYTSMNEVLDATALNSDNDFAMFDVANQFEGLGRRNFSQHMQVVMVQHPAN
jgi:hypothetical protein